MNKIKKISQLPPFSGLSKNLTMLAVRKDTGETVKFEFEDFLAELTKGVVVPALADELNINGEAITSHTQNALLETAGGDKSIKNGTARIRSFRGTNSGVPASNAKIIATGFNLANPANINGQQLTVTVVKGVFGSYGSAEQNNGYLFTLPNNVIVVPTSVKQNGSAVPTRTVDGITYYLPSQNGTMVATFASDVVMSNVCCHICWSNYRDLDHEAYSASELNLSSVITSAGGTLKRANGLGGFVCDEIKFGTSSAERQWYRRVGEVALSSLNFAAVVAENSETTYKYSAEIPGFKAGGIYQLVGSSLTAYVSEKALIIETNQESLSGVNLQGSVKFELETPVTGTHSLTGEITVNDFGLIMLSTASAASEIDFDIDFQTMWKDFIKNLSTEFDREGSVIATAINAIARKIDSIERNLSGKMQKLSVEELNISRKFNAKLAGGNFKIHGNGSPQENALIPEFIGQEYYDLTNNKKYEAFGVDSADNWIVMN